MVCYQDLTSKGSQAAQQLLRRKTPPIHSSPQRAQGEELPPLAPSPHSTLLNLLVLPSHVTFCFKADL